MLFRLQLSPLPSNFLHHSFTTSSTFNPQPTSTFSNATSARSEAELTLCSSQTRLSTPIASNRPQTAAHCSVSAGPSNLTARLENCSKRGLGATARALVTPCCTLLHPRKSRPSLNPHFYQSLTIGSLGSPASFVFLFS